MTQIEADISNETQISPFSDSNSTQNRYKIKNLAHRLVEGRKHGTLSQIEQMDKRILIYRTWFASFVLVCRRPVLIICALIAMRRFSNLVAQSPWVEWGVHCTADSWVPFPEILTQQIRCGFRGSALLTNTYMGPSSYHPLIP